MARMSDLSRLFKPDPAPRVELPPPAAESKRIDVLEPDLMQLYQASLLQPVRRRFGLPRSSRADSPAMMSTMSPSVAIDRGGDLRDLAARDRVRTLLMQHAARGRGDGQRPDLYGAIWA
jgi:hypothetical protein